MKLIKGYLNASFLLKMTIGFVLGIAAGIIIGPPAEIVAPLGMVFIKLLNMVIVPLIFFTLIVAVNNTDPGGLGRVGGKIFLYYISTTVIAVTIGITAAVLFKPGKNTSINLAEFDSEAVEQPPFIDTMLNIIPANILEALSTANILAIVFAALVFGFAISYMRFGKEERMHELGELLFKFADAITEMTILVLKGILQYAPIGVFGIGAAAFANQSLDVLKSLAGFTVLTYGGLITHILIVYVVLLLIFKVPVLKFFNDIKECMVMSFITSSSLGTLPLTLRAAKKAGISEDVSSFTLPIGATVNMDGGAIRLGIGALFAANLVGVDLTLLEMVLIVVTATLTSIGTAGVPGSGLIALTIVLTQAGLPLEVVAIIAGVDAVVQMGSTMTNVIGDVVGAKIVDESEKKYRTADAEGILAVSKVQSNLE